MRSKKIARAAVRAIVVGLVTAGAWFAATSVASADFTWTISPSDGSPTAPVTQDPQPAGIGR